MSTGQYVKKPINFNPKCLVFSIVISSIYWFSPAKKNIFVLPILFVAAYAAMAWYDKLYNCDTVLLSGSATVSGATYTSVFKPQEVNAGVLSEEEKEKLLPSAEQERVYLRNVYLFHVTAIVPLLYYVGIQGAKADPRAFGALIGVATLAGLYHTSRLFSPRV